MRSNFLTTKYKFGFIHTYSYKGMEFVQVQVDQFAYAINVKSIKAAKIMITKHLKKTKIENLLKEINKIN